MQHDRLYYNKKQRITTASMKSCEINYSSHKKRKTKRNDAYAQLENTLKIFKSKNIDLSGYKLFVIASVLDYNPPVTKMPAATTKSQNAKVRFEEYNAILLTGQIYEFT